MSAHSFMGGELRRWRYFVVVAEELHMTRAARRLHVAQPSLSQQIRRLEADLGVTLFRRGARGLTLTAAGEVFADEAVQAIALVDRAVRRARDRGRGIGGVLRVGFITTAAAELTPAIMRAFKQRYPEVRLQLRQFQLDDPYAGLLRDLTDVAIVMAPLEAAKVAVHPLYRQPRVAIVPTGHKLASASRVQIGDLIDERFVVNRGHAPEEWVRFWLGENHRGGSPARIGAEYGTVDEKFELVGLGAGISLLPSSSARYYGRPGVTHLALPQLEPCEVLLAARKDADDEKVNAFVSNALHVASTLARDKLPAGQVVWAPGPSDLEPA